MIRELGDRFEAHGWDDRESVALAIVEAARESNSLDAAAAAALAPDAFLARNRIVRTSLEEAIAAVFAGRRLLPPERDYPAHVEQISKVEVHGDHNSLVNVSTGDQAFIVNPDSSKTAILAAVTDLVREGLELQLSKTKLEQLDRLVSERDDLDRAELEAEVGEAINGVASEPGKLVQLRDAVVASAASGLLVQAIITVVDSIA